MIISLAAGAGAFVLLDRLALLKLGEARRPPRRALPRRLPHHALPRRGLQRVAVPAALPGGLPPRRARPVWCAGVAGGLAALTRPVGLALLPALVFLAWRSPDRRRALAGVSAIPALFALYPLTLWIWLGHPLAFLAAQKGIWHRHFSSWGPFGGFVEGVEQHAVKDLLVAAVLIALAVIAWRRLGAAYGIYTLTSLALPLSWPSDTHALWSIARFGLVLFPVVLTLAALTTTRLRTALVTLGLTAFCIDSVVKWALWYWVA